MNKSEHTTALNYGKLIGKRLFSGYPDFILGSLVVFVVIFTLFKIIPFGKFTALFNKQSVIKPVQNTKSVPVPGNFEKYTVQKGDTLSIISLKYYGDMFAWEKILKANKLSNPDTIEEGTVLLIPR